MEPVPKSFNDELREEILKRHSRTNAVLLFVAIALSLWLGFIIGVDHERWAQAKRAAVNVAP